MFSLVEARFSIVCWINTASNTVKSDASNERNDPLRRVVTHDIDTSPLFDAKSMHGFGKKLDISAIFIP